MESKMDRNPFEKRTYKTEYYTESHYLNQFEEIYRQPYLRLFSIGETCILKPYLQSAFTKSVWRMSLITEGSGTVRLESAEYPLKKGDVYFYNKPFELKFTPDKGTVLRKKNLLIRDDLIIDFMCRKNDALPIEIIHLKEPQRLESYLARIMELAENNHPFLADEISLNIFGCINEYNRSRDLTEKMDTFSRIVQSITDSPDSIHNLNDLANTFKLSRRSIFRLFKKHFGVPPMTYIIRCKLEKSLWYLVYQDTPMNLIAEISGFKNQQDFSRVFRHSYGMTPSEYRKSKQKKEITASPNYRLNLSVGKPQK